MSDFREEEKLGKLYDSQLTRRLLKYLRPYRWHVVGAVSFTLAITGMELAGPYLFYLGIDKYIVPGYDGTITRHTAMMGLLWVVIAYAGSIFASFGLQYVQVRIMQWVGQQTMFDLRREIFSHLQRLPMSFFDRTPIGRLVTRSTTDVDALNDLFASGVVAMLNDFVLLFAMAAVLFRWHKMLALATLSPLPFMILLTYFFRTRVRDANRRIRTAIARINAFLQEHVSGMSVVQLFNREKKSRAQFEELNMRAHGGVQGCDRRVLALLPCRGISEHERHRIAFVGGRHARDRRHDRHRCGCGVHDVRPALLPSNSGPQRKIQYFAERDGGVGADIPAAGRAGDDHVSPEGDNDRIAARRNRVSQCVVLVHRRCGAKGR